MEPREVDTLIEEEAGQSGHNLAYLLDNQCELFSSTGMNVYYALLNGNPRMARGFTSATMDIVSVRLRDGTLVAMCLGN